MRTTASAAAVFCCVLAGTLNAQELGGPAGSPGTSTTAPKRSATSNGRTKYSTDPAQTRFATLESEAVFFERLGKQDKIELAQTRISEARQRFHDARRDLAPAGVGQLVDAGREIDRALESMDVASRNLVTARSELSRYHQATTPEAVAIAAGKLDAAPLYAKIRRLIKTAERSLRDVRFHATENRYGAATRVDEAQTAAAKSVELLAADDPRRAKLGDVVTEIGTIKDGLSEVNQEINALIDGLEAIRRDRLPECFLPGGPALKPHAHAGTGPNEMTRDQEAARRVTTLELLNQSLPAVARLDEVAEQAAAIDNTLRRLAKSTDATVQHAEEADAIVNKLQHEARQLQAQAVRLVDQADEQLDNITRLLADARSVDDAGPAEPKHCSHCGKLIPRTQQVQDPATLCARSEEPMRQVEESLGQARTLAVKMDAVLDQIMPPADETEENRRRLRSAKLQVRGNLEAGDFGALQYLSFAMERTQEFRKQQFEFYPGESYPPAAEETPPREFPPIVATYVARETWHHPDYFEDLSLERYGHNFGCLQPFVSYGKFLTDLAMLPYNAWLEPPCTRQYTLGLYRPGDCVPRLIYLPRPDLGAAAFEAGVWTGLIFFP